MIVRFEVGIDEAEHILVLFLQISKIDWSYVRFSHPPILPLLTGSLTPTAPLFPMPPQYNPKVAVDGFPILPSMVVSREKIQSAFPTWATLATKEYLSCVLLGDKELAWADKRFSIRLVRARSTGSLKPATTSHVSTDCEME